ncbi:marker of proliferation Ki-67 [Rhinolophus ferrumequinum]|uniref:Marker of proliferation Ki-67 n=1 Tax=Rhinolophus ferrumequinum TaxID=59479 RepID=A0A7J7UXL4_RHIFE|nr:marker of proliferation Ki-67 [Rhinolophus ferrumequinum]
MGPTGHLVTIKRSGVDGPHFPLSLSTCLFGRGIECDIRIQLPVVSKEHCKIEIKEQKAILFNFSSTYPTQLNGSAIDEPVQLKHGDVITIVDRSFRYEDESHQNGSKSTEFPGQRHEQASPRQVSTSGFCSDPDGKVQDPKACSKLTEESVSGRPLVHVGEVRAAQPVSHASEEPVARETPSVHLSHLSGDDGREVAGPTAGDAKDVSSVPALSGNGQLPSFPSMQCLENSEENESPFRELYESMKEKLDRRSEKENVLRSRRKSGSRSHCVAENESAGGLQGETPRPVSPKSRRTSGRSSQSKADPALGAQPSGQTEEKGSHAGPVQTPKVTLSPSVPRKEATETGTPGPCSHQSFTPKRRSGGRSVINRDEPVNLDESGESSRADKGTLLPRKSLTRNQTPTKLENADNVGNTPGKVLSKKRRRSSSVPANVDILIIDTETQKQTALGPLLVQVDRKMPDGALGTFELLGAQAGQRCPGSPGLRSVDVSNLGDSTNMIEGTPLKRRRVSFGGHLRPELFDENLPPNTPLKRGETPMKRRSLVTHTATTVLKKIIKEQSQPSGKEDCSSETHLGVTAQNVFRSSPAQNPVKTPAANDKHRRSSEPSSASSGGVSPQRTETPKRGGRRSSSGPARRTSVDRSQQEILQLIHSKRRSGASEANLIVAKSWADVVKLSAKQTQTKVVKHGPRKQLNKRQRRINTPKKPASSIHNQFSTGHANSPCTIVVGKAHIEKVNVPARPYRMLNNFVFNQKIDFNEDLSGLTEMFKTPAKEKPHVRSLCSITFSNSEDLRSVPKPEEKPLLCTPENYGDNVFPSTQNVPEQMSDKRSASPALRRHCFAVNENMKTVLSEADPPKVESSTNKFRRSMELRNTQVPGAECENKDEEANAVENILGKHLRKTREEKLEEEMKESERTFETCKKNIESKENSEKMIAVKRSRRSSEMKYAQRADLITPKKLQEIEPKKELVDIHSLGTPGHTKESVEVEKRSAMMNCKSPEPDSVSTPVKMNVRIKPPSQKVNVGQLSARGRSTQTPGETTHSHREQIGDDKIIELFKETPEQKLDPTENVTGSRRRSRTPKKTVQPLEDLAGFRELFQTPNRSVEPVVDDKTTKTRHKSPKPEPVIMSGDDKDIRAFKETPEQKLDPTENVTGSRRRSRTPQRKVQPLEDMTGLKELFQTPKRTVESVTDGGTTKIPRKSPKPELVSMPGGDKDIREFNETPEQKLDSGENVTGSRKRPRTPKRKVQLLEDMAGFKELFQTPNRSMEPEVDDKTKVFCQSTQPEPIVISTSMLRQLRTPPKKVSGEEDVSALRKSTRTPGGTMGSPRDPRGDGKIIKFFKESPEQKLDSAENVTGSRKKPRTSKKKVQPLEDLAGLRELFQTPNRPVEPVVDDKTTKIRHKSPKPEPVIMSGDDKDIRAFKETPEQKLDPTENVTGSRRRSRTPQRKVQPLEDLAGFKELFQTPKRTVEPVTDDKTKIPCESPQVEAVMPIGRKSRLKAPPRKADIEVEPLSLRKPTRTSRKTTRSHREPHGDEKDVTVFKESALQKPDPANNVTRSKRKPRTPEESAQLLEDLAGLEEPFQTPDHRVEPVTNDKTKIPCKSPQAEAVMPIGRKSRLKAPPGKADIEVELLSLRKPTRASRKTTRSHREPDGDEKDAMVFKESAVQKPDPANNVTRSKRKPRTRKENIQPTEHLAGLEEPFQTPNHTVEPVTDDKTKIPCESPQAEAVVPIGRKSRRKAPPRKADIEVEPLSLRKPTRTSRKTTRSHREPEGDVKDVTVFKESAVQKPDPAKNVTRSKRKPRTPEERAQLLEDLAGLEEPFQTPDHTDEPVTVVKTTRIRCQSSQPGPSILPASKKRQLKAAPGKANGEEEPTAPRKPTRTGRSTRAHRESVDGHQDVIVCEGTAKPKQGPAENAMGSKRLLRTRKAKAPPLEVAAGCPELLQTADPDKEHGNDAGMVKSTPTQTPDRREPVKTSRRVLRAPHVKPMDDLAGSRDPIESQSESSISQSPKRKRGKEGTVTGRERLGSTTCPQDTALEMPLQKRQRTAPRERCEPPAPLITKKKSQRVLAGRTEPVEELPGNSMRTKTQEEKAEAVASSAKGISLRSRPPNKTSGAEQQRPEFLESAEKTNVKRNEKKAPNTSQEVKLQHLEDGAKNSTSGGQVRERRMCLRSGRQSTKHLSDVTEEKAQEKSVEIHVMKKTQEEKEGSKRSGSVGLRPKKMTGDTLEKESKQRVTRSVKRSTENIKKEDDNGCIKKLRTRRHRGSEDI